MSGPYERGQQKAKCKETKENGIILYNSVIRPDLSSSAQSDRDHRDRDMEVFVLNIDCKNNNKK